MEGDAEVDMGINVRHCKYEEDIMDHAKVLKIGRWVLLSLVLAVVLSSCKGGPTRGILSFMPDTIDGFGAFLHAWFIIVLATIVLQFLLSFIGIGGWIVDVILFILVLWLRDYGFWMTLLLFLFSSLVGFLLSLLYARRR